MLYRTNITTNITRNKQNDLIPNLINFYHMNICGNPIIWVLLVTSVSTNHNAADLESVLC